MRRTRLKPFGYEYGFFHCVCCVGRRDTANRQVKNIPLLLAIVMPSPPEFVQRACVVLSGGPDALLTPELFRRAKRDELSRLGRKIRRVSKGDPSHSMWRKKGDERDENSASASVSKHNPKVVQNTWTNAAEKVERAERLNATDG